MKLIITAIALLLLMAASDYCRADDWRTQDTVREVAWQGLNLVDLRTTLDGAQYNRAGGKRLYAADGSYQTELYQEKNPLLGDFPSPRRVVNGMLLGAVVHAGVSYALPHGWRDAWQYLTIGTSAYCVRQNLSIGLEVNF